MLDRRKKTLEPEPAAAQKEVDGAHKNVRLPKVSERPALDHAKHIAYESIETYESGKLKNKECRIGSSVPRAIVALVAILLGKAALSLAPSFWEFFKR